MGAYLDKRGEKRGTLPCHPGSHRTQSDTPPPPALIPPLRLLWVCYDSSWRQLNCCLLCLLIGLKGWNLDTERDHCCCLPSTAASLGTFWVKGSSLPSGSLHPFPVSARGTKVWGDSSSSHWFGVVWASIALKRQAQHLSRSAGQAWGHQEFLAEGSHMLSFSNLVVPSSGTLALPLPPADQA